MSAIIAQLIAIFGPLLVEALKKWLESLLNRAANNVPKNANAATLLNAAIDLTPRVRVGRRALLRLIRDKSHDAIAAGELNAADKKEIRLLAAAAE